MKTPRPTVTKVGPADAGAFYRFPIRPMPKERPRAKIIKVKGKIRAVIYTPSTTEHYEKQIGLATEFQHPIDQPYQGDLTAFICFFLSTRVHGDVDNLTKAILDGMNKVAFKDDKQIKSLHVDLIFTRDSDERDKQERTEVILMPHRNKPTIPAPDTTLDFEELFDE